jgi:hypothetical protein
MIYSDPLERELMHYYYMKSSSNAVLAFAAGPVGPSKRWI